MSALAVYSRIHVCHRGHGPRSPQLGKGYRRKHSQSGRYELKKLADCPELVRDCILKLFLAAKVDAQVSPSVAARNVGYQIKKKLADFTQFLSRGLRPLKCFAKQQRVQFKFLMNSRAFLVPVDIEEFYSA